MRIRKLAERFAGREEVLTVEGANRLTMVIEAVRLEAISTRHGQTAAKIAQKLAGAER